MLEKILSLVGNAILDCDPSAKTSDPFKVLLSNGFRVIDTSMRAQAALGNTARVLTNGKVPSGKWISST